MYFLMTPQAANFCAQSNVGLRVCLKFAIVFCCNRSSGPYMNPEMFKTAADTGRLGVSALAMLFAFTAWGQMTRSLAGTVTDPSGAIIPGAKVTATQHAMGVSFERVTNSAGAYVFEDLPLGVYTVQIAAPSFRTLRVEGIEIHEASAIRQDASLELAARNTQVQVKSSTPLVNTETAEIGQLVDSRQITQLPLNGRDVFSLLRLAGGAETAVSDAARYTSLERPALAGGRAGFTVFRVDGVDVNSQNLPSATVTPGVDAVEEFRAITTLAPVRKVPPPV